MGFTLFYIEPLSKGRHKQGCQEIMANPAGAKAGEPYQNLDGEGFPSESTTSLPYREGLGIGGCLF
jgi:hypothetical protein